MSSIFTPLTTCGRQIKNRIVIPPLVVFGLPDDGSDTVQAEQVRHYRIRANGGAGMLIVESATTDPVHEHRAMIGVYDERFTGGLKRLADVCKENGTTAIQQITNTGLELMPYMTLAEMPAGEFERYRDAFVKAAAICRTAGFDGVELHGAHGFYLNQVLELNNRGDQYGDGNAVVSGIIKDVRSICGDDFIIDVRIGNHDIDALIRTAKAMEAAGADLLHVSKGAWNEGGGALAKHSEKAALLHSPQPTEPAPEGFPYDYTMYMASRVKPEVKIPVIGIGGIRRPEEAEDVLEKGYADFVALGRQSLADPEWVNKVKAGAEPDFCRNCKACQWMNDATGKRCPARLIAGRKTSKTKEA